MNSLNTPMSYHRLNRQPLDDSEVFSSLKDLMDYCDNMARYDGQRVVVTANNSHNLPAIEYVIKNNIPIISNMMGSELIFREDINFFGDSSANSAGLLIYENNDNGSWKPNSTYIMEEGHLCLISQAEIFRSKTKSYKFYLERIKRNGFLNPGETTKYYCSWEQNFNPFTATGTYPKVGTLLNNGIHSLFVIQGNDYLDVDTTGLRLMPHTDSELESEKNWITRIYIKADDYYKAYKGR